MTARWGNELFAEIPTSVGTVAIASSRTVAVFGDGAARAAADRTVIVEFLVDDVDETFRTLFGDGVGTDVVGEPTTMPWTQPGGAGPRPGREPREAFTPVGAEALARNPVR